MIYFEHEVLNFGTRTKKDRAAMKASLTEWGAAGYEAVSVVPASLDGSVVNVFLKREVYAKSQDEGKAA